MRLWRGATSEKHFHFATVFVRNGYVNISNGYLQGSGTVSYTWPSQASFDLRYAYRLAFNASTSVDPSSGDDRSNTFPLRYLAR